MAVRRTASPPIATDQEPEMPPPGPHAVREPDPGWWRNVGETPLDIAGDGVGITLPPGRIAFLPWAGTHRDLAPATRAEFDAQTRADAAADAEPAVEAAQEPAPEAEPAQSQE